MDSELLVEETANPSLPSQPPLRKNVESGTKEGVAGDFNKAEIILTTADSCLSVTTNPVGAVSGERNEGSSKRKTFFSKRLSKAEQEAARMCKLKERLEAKARKEAEHQRKEAERQKKKEEMRMKKEQIEKEQKERRERKEYEKRKKLQEQQLKLEAKQKRKDEKRKKEQDEEFLREEKLKKEKIKKDKFLEFFSKPTHKEQNLSDIKARNGSQETWTPYPTHNALPAQLTRKSMQDIAQFDCVLAQQQACSHSYLDECKRKKLAVVAGMKFRVSLAGEDMVDLTDCSMPVPPNGSNIYCKLLQFHTNHRPAYFGSWRKTSKIISPRNPFRKDLEMVDYDVDSDDEWEEEEPGESLSHSEEDDVSIDEEDEDDGFFVPHGYLSEGEGEGSEGEMENREKRMEKQHAEAKAWELEFSRKQHILKPVKIGISWACNLSDEQSALLGQFAARAFQPMPIPVGVASPISKISSATAGFSNYQPVPEEAMPELIRLVHKSTMGIKKLVKIFRVHWGAKQPHPPAMPSSLEQLPGMHSPMVVSPGINHQVTTPSSEEHYANICNISKRQLENKILAIATKEVRSQKAMWYVNPEILQQYGFSGAVVPLEVLGLSAVNKSVDHTAGRRGTKRSSSHPPVKTLQHFFQTSPLSQTQQSSTSSGRIQPSDSSHAPVKTPEEFYPPPLASPQPDKEAPLPTYNQVARKLLLSSETHLPKRARLDNTSPIAINTDHNYIVIDSDESTELGVETAASRKDEPMEVDKPKETPVLEECTNRSCSAPSTETIGPTKADWKSQWVENNKLEVSVDVHL